MRSPSPLRSSGPTPAGLPSDRARGGRSEDGGWRGGSSSPPGGWPSRSQSPVCRRGVGVGWGAQLMLHPGRMLRLSTERAGVGCSARGEDRATGRPEAEREAAAGALSVPYGHWTLWPRNRITTSSGCFLDFPFFFFFTPLHPRRRSESPTPCNASAGLASFGNWVMQPRPHSGLFALHLRGHGNPLHSLWRSPPRRDQGCVKAIIMARKSILFEEL